MASSKLSALSAVSGSLTSDSLLYIADTQDSGSSYSSKKITVSSLLSDVASTTDLGTFTGSTIANNQSIKAAIQALETALETESSARATAISDLVDGAPGVLDTLNEIAAAINDDENFVTTITNLINANETHIDNVATLSGVAKDSANLGTFTGSTIADSSTIKAAIQALETALELKAASSVVTEIDANADDLITLSGVAENSTGLGTFTGSTISDASTIKDALQDLETAVEGAQAGSAVADRSKTQTGDADTTHYVTFVADDNSSATAETIYTDGGITYNPASNLLTLGTGNLTTLQLGGVAVTSTAAELNVLDGITATTAELNYTDGVTSNIQTQLDAKQPLDADLTALASCQAGAASALAALTSTEVAILDGATVTTAELNILDGVTSTAAELNILDGVTSTAAELNILDGVTSSTAELNLLDGVTATTAELNYTDGVTSNIQTQLDAKCATGANVNTLVGTTSAQTVPVDGSGDDNYLFLVVNKSNGALTAISKTFMEIE